LSTRFSSEVSTVPGNSGFWFESMPMASLPSSFAACSAPKPVMPAAAKITSTPRSN
jgi:hypothetical protein